MAETLINSNQTSGVWNKDNLKSGPNIQIVPELQPLIDDNTLGVWHFNSAAYPDDTDGVFENSVLNSNLVFNRTVTRSGSSGRYDGYTSYVNDYYKFGEGGFCTQTVSGGYSQQIISALTGGTNSDIGEGDFTVDFWVLRRDNNWGPQVGINGWIYVIPTNNGSVTLYNGSNNVLYSGSGYPSGAFLHCAFERFSNTVNAYLNGTKVYTVDVSSGIVNPNDLFVFYGTPTRFWGTYIDELRISNIARYRGENFTPFTTQYTYGGEPTYNLESNGLVTTAELQTTQSQLEESIATKQDTMSAGKDIEFLGIQNFKASGFSNSNFFTIPNSKDFPGNTWEQQWHVKTDSNATSTWNNSQYVCSGYDKVYSDFGIQNGYWNLFLSSDGATWDIVNGVGRNTRVQNSTEYILNLSYNGSQYILKGSTDFGQTWVTFDTYATSTKVYPITAFILGNSQDNLWAWKGEIFVDEYSYIKVDGQYLFKGGGAVIGEDITKIGSPTVTYTGNTVYRVDNTAPNVLEATGYDATKTQVLKNINGVLTWVDEA